jgi:GntR family transcriptional regulator/MocR family aminotransferase
MTMQECAPSRSLAPRSPVRTGSGRRPPTLAASAVWSDPLPPQGQRQAYIRDAILARIREGALISGSRLPSSRDASRLLGVSRLTVVSAYEQLAQARILVFRRGAGSYVAVGAAARLSQA